MISDVQVDIPNYKLVGTFANVTSIGETFLDLAKKVV